MSLPRPGPSHLPPDASPAGGVRAPPASSATSPGVPVASRPPATRRGLALGLVLLAALAAGAWFGWRWWTHGRFHVTTENAYVGAYTARVGSEIAGTVTEVLVEDTQSVTVGAPLVRLDRAEAELAVAEAEAALDQATRGVREMRAMGESLRAQVAARTAELANAREELERRESLREGGNVSAEALGQAREAAAASQAMVAAAREELRANEAMVGGTPVEDHPSVRAAASRLARARLDLARTEIRAPLTGTVVNRRVQVGARVADGTPLLEIVPLDRLFVDANFKENQLARVRVGQTATLTSDLYGHAVRYTGRVVGLGAATGAATALLPAQNATGNWIKVVQRLPVRIALDPAELAAHPLRVGLTMTVEVQVGPEPAPVPAP